VKDVSVDVSLTRAQRVAIADLFPQMADRLKVDLNRQTKIAFTVPQMQAIWWCAGEAVPTATSGMKRNSLHCIIAAFRQAIEDAHGIAAIAPSKRLYQFKVTLLHIDPRIWRRIQVKDCSVDKLHECIQTAMGWTNSHLHRFEIQGIVCGDPELVCDNPESFVGINSREAMVSQMVPQSGSRFQFSYEYDFGDCWRHEVLFEGCLASDRGVRYPKCLEGERCCPPEDVGGVSGYEEFLEVIADRSHSEHNEWMIWAGGDFDPERFDPKVATRDMQQGLPDWRQLESLVY
jgi:hypothetical protein